MPETISAERAEQKARGKTLRRLRERLDLTQADAAERLGVSTQAWQRYEAGDRKLPDSRMDELGAVLGASQADWQAERARILRQPAPAGRASAPPRGLHTPSTPFVLPVIGFARAGPEGPQVFDVGEPETVIDVRAVLGRNSRATQVAGDSVSPYAESGMHVVYELDRWPRRGEGCVVELNSGELLVKLYLRQEAGHVVVEELQPMQRELVFDKGDVKGVYRVRARLD